MRTWKALEGAEGWLLLLLLSLLLRSAREELQSRAMGVRGEGGPEGERGGLPGGGP